MNIIKPCSRRLWTIVILVLSMSRTIVHIRNNSINEVLFVSNYTIKIYSTETVLFRRWIVVQLVVMVELWRHLWKWNTNTCPDVYRTFSIGWWAWLCRTTTESKNMLPSTMPRYVLPNKAPTYSVMTDRDIFVRCKHTEILHALKYLSVAVSRKNTNQRIYLISPKPSTS